MGPVAALHDGVRRAPGADVARGQADRIGDEEECVLRDHLSVATTLR
jgi:hypothetical protein